MYLGIFDGIWVETGEVRGVMGEKKIKVGIVTIESNNFGNRLQNYALQEVLKGFGFEVETIRREKPLRLNGKMIKNVKELFQFVLQTKGAKFSSFNKNIIRSKWYATANDAQEGLAENYDFFVSGSDQVWNPHYKFTGKTDLLYFAPEEKRVSYAASFGVNYIPAEKKGLFKEELCSFKKISVREEQGAQIVFELTGKTAEVVLDPTFLLEKSAWRKLEKKPSCKVPSPYILVYALGEKSDSFKQELKKYEQTNKIFDIRSCDLRGREIPAGPGEFLYLISHADMIMTDSFHAAVFSLIYHKKVMVFKREGLNMNSRIDSLAGELHLRDKMDENGNLILIQNMDYGRFEDYLGKEKEKSMEFLKKAFNK